MGTARDRVMLTASVGLSAAGDTLAIAPLATILAAETGSGFAVAAFFGALWGPSVVLGSVAGRIVDRFENVRLLTVVSLAQAVVAASMIVALDSIPALLVLAAMIGTGNAVAQAAEFSLSPVAAGEDGVARLNGWIESSRYLGMTIGPALGGLLAAAGHPRSPSPATPSPSSPSSRSRFRSRSAVTPRRPSTGPAVASRPARRARDSPFCAAHRRRSGRRS